MGVVRETAVVFGREEASGPKGSINLRIEMQTRQLIDDAASVLGKSRTEFMVEAARMLAINVLLDQRLVVIDAAPFDSFVDALDNAPPPGPKLAALMKRAPAWTASEASTTAE